MSLDNTRLIARSEAAKAVAKLGGYTIVNTVTNGNAYSVLASIPIEDKTAGIIHLFTSGAKEDLTNYQSLYVFNYSRNGTLSLGTSVNIFTQNNAVAAINFVVVGDTIEIRVNTNSGLTNWTGSYFINAVLAPETEVILT